MNAKSGVSRCLFFDWLGVRSMSVMVDLHIMEHRVSL